MTNNVPFNNGFYCNKCGVFEKTVERQINKKKFPTCPTCASTHFNKWSKPLNERPGRCGTCGGSQFKMAIYKHDLLRCCKTCSEVFNIDKNKVKRPGKKEFKC